MITKCDFSKHSEYLQSLKIYYVEKISLINYYIKIETKITKTNYNPMKIPQLIYRYRNASIILLIYIIFSSFLAYYYILESVVKAGKSFDIVDICFILITTLCLFLFITIFIKSRNYFILALGSLMLFLFLCEISYIIYFGEIISKGVLDSLLETNVHEAWSMSEQVLIITCPALLITLTIVFVYRKFISVKFRITIPLSFYIILFCGLFTLILGTPIKKEIKNGDFNAMSELIRIYFPALTGNLLYVGIKPISTDIYSNFNEIEEFNEAILLPPKKTDNDLVVLIMGESSLVTRYSAYGYDKPTTPFMTEIFNQKNGCIIKNAHSTAALTRESIPMTLSFNIPESDNNLFNNKSIIEMAKYNDYKTFWLASIHQSITNSFSTKFSFIARKSNYIEFTTDNHDISLSKLLEDQLKNDNSPKKFIFIHLRGSHKLYTNYDEIDKQAIPNAEDYDLTIHHTDRVVKALYDVIKTYSDNYTLIYTSDHGEIVNVGHGFVKGIDQFLIPFMMISTKNEFNCQFIESFRATNGYLSGSMNKYILSNLLGYEIEPTILNQEKNNDRVYLSNNTVMPFLEFLEKN